MLDIYYFSHTMMINKITGELTNEEVSCDIQKNNKFMNVLVTRYCSIAAINRKYSLMLLKP